MTCRIWPICLTLLVFTFVFNGCNSPSRPGKAKEPKELARTQAEKDKARLLRRIDRKYEDAEAHFKLGNLYQADGLWAQAENEYKTVLNFDPVHRQAQAARVKMLIVGGDQAKAELLADEYLNQVSNFELASLNLALAFQKQLLDDYALAAYNLALRLAPNSAKINRQIGYYYLSKGEKIQAKDYLSRSFQLNPNQPDVAGQLGRLGVAVRIPKKTSRKTKKLDKIINKYDKQADR